MKKYKNFHYHHKSDCSIFNAPAMEPEDCDCGVALALLDEAKLFVMHGENPMYPDKQDLIDEINYCFAETHKEIKP